MQARSVELPSTPVSRRQVWLRIALLAAVAASALAVLGMMWAWLVPGNLLPRHATYALADLEVNVPVFYQPFDMGARRGVASGIWLVRRPDDSVLALWSTPAHPRACPVRPSAVEVPRDYAGDPSTLPPAPPSLLRDVNPGGQLLGFRDACLGSTFLIDGTRTFGPAPRGLDRFPTTVEGGKVTIDLRRVLLGECGSFPPRNCSRPGEQRTEPARWPSLD